MSAGWRGEWRLLGRDRAFLLTLVFLSVLTLWCLVEGEQRGRQQRLRAAGHHAENLMHQSWLIAGVTEESAPEEFRHWSGRALTPAESARARQLTSRSHSPLVLAFQEDVWRTWFPAAPLTALSAGESDKWPDDYRLQGGSMGATLHVPRLLNPFHTTTGRMDLSLLVIVLLPLGTIVALHDLLSGERERRTLRLILSQPVSLMAVLFRKLLVRWSGLTGIVVCSCLVGLLLLGITVWEPVVAVRWAAWGVLVALYVLFWSGLAWLVNSWRFSSVTNAVWLTLLWVLLVFVIPPTLSRVIAETWPLESAEVLQSREAALLREYEEQEDELYENFMDEHAGREPEERNALWQAVEADLQRQQEADLSALVEAHHRLHESRLAAERRWEWLSPAFLMKLSCDELAGTSARQYRLFARETTDFQARLQRYFLNLAAQGEDPIPHDWEQLPIYQNPGLESRVDWGQWLIRVGVLLFLTGVCFGIGYYRLAWQTEPG